MITAEHLLANLLAIVKTPADEGTELQARTTQEALAPDSWRIPGGAQTGSK